MFFLKLASQNLRKNKRAYLPFFVSMIFLVALNTVTQLIITNPDMSDLPGGSSAQAMFSLGGIVILIFTVIFAVYTNSFLLKQRQREFGLYNVLGMGKRDLYRLVFWENVFSFLTSLIAGILTGFVFSKLSFLILQKIIAAKTVFHFEVAPNVLTTVFLLFFVIYILLLLIDMWRIHRTNPIELLHSDRSGEKEPKSKWILTTIGLICLGIGYYWAVTIKTPMDAITLFFGAVILVIIGTYCLFTAGSITLLKFLKKRPKFYYKANHFISVSNMIYRMKQNAAGLASICILSTMVLVTMSTTISLYIGRENTTESLYPYDIRITSQENPKKINQAIEDSLKKYPEVTLKHRSQAPITNIPLVAQGQKLVLQNPKLSSAKNIVYVTFITAKTYEQLTGDKANLEANKVIAYPVTGNVIDRHFTLNNQKFTVQKVIHSLPNLKQPQQAMDSLLLVMPDHTTIQQLNQQYNKENDEQPTQENTFVFDIQAPQNKTRLAFKDHLKKTLPKGKYGLIGFDSKDEFKATNNIITGGFLFLGVIFGLTFTVATALIIYYKQVSEGLDDKRRFEILQKVGMEHRAVKKVIHSQILTVFFFPIVVAIIHLSFAFSFIKKLLLLFGLLNTQLILWTTIASVIGFAIIYFIVYQLTAKAYYQIVER